MFTSALKMAAGRVYWSDEESELLLNIMEEKNILKLRDGKRYKRCEIFKIIQNEFKTRGFSDKSSLNIENKWKNMKKQYVAAKKVNKRSGEGRTSCDFYEHLDRLLGARPSSSKIPNAIDSEDIVVTEIIEIDDPAGQEESGRGSRKRKGTINSEIAKTIKSVCGDLQKEFLENQKEVMKQEFELYAQEERAQIKMYCEETKKILDESNRNFLSEVRQLFSDAGATTSKKPDNVETELCEFLQFQK